MKYIGHFLLTFLLLLFTGAASSQAASDAIRTIPIHVTNSKTVEATLHLPDHLAKGQKVPVYMIFGGFESAANVLSLIHADRPVALASFDYPFAGSRKLQIKDAPQILSEAKQLFPETVRGISELANFLRGQPEIDPKQIVAIGASFGSPFVLAAAAGTPAITKVVVVHGFGLPMETAEHVILRSWIPKYGRISTPIAWLISQMAWRYLGIEAPESFAQQLTSQQAVMMITAQNDSFIPRSASDSLWTAIAGSKAATKRIIMSGDHLMPGADQQIDQIMRQIEAWMDGMR